MLEAIKKEPPATCMGNGRFLFTQDTSGLTENAEGKLYKLNYRITIIYSAKTGKK